MKVLGIDFTSRPSKRKPITCVTCTLRDRRLEFQGLQEWTSYQQFEMELERAGPWIAGLDFPFSMSRRFIETIGWPRSWPDLVLHTKLLGREGFREQLEEYKRFRDPGDKEHRRRVDRLAGAISPQKLYGVPVALMFFEGAPRLLAAGITVAHLHGGDPQRIAVEAYPGVLARRLIGRRSYKNDARTKQAPDHKAARFQLLEGLRQLGPQLYGFEIEAPDILGIDPGGDHLDALICALQAAWAWRHRYDRFGAPPDVDPVEGWIADPSVLEPS